VRYLFDRCGNRDVDLDLPASRFARHRDELLSSAPTAVSRPITTVIAGGARLDGAESDPRTATITTPSHEQKHRATHGPPSLHPGHQDAPPRERPGDVVRPTAHCLDQSDHLNDGFALANLVSYEAKGEDNHHGTDDNPAGTAASRGSTDDQGMLVLRKQQRGSFLATLHPSEGVSPSSPATSSAATNGATTRILPGQRDQLGALVVGRRGWRSSRARRVPLRCTTVAITGPSGRFTLLINAWSEPLTFRPATCMRAESLSLLIDTGCHGAAACDLGAAEEVVVVGQSLMVVDRPPGRP
jgi:hypothetical protein